MLPDFSREDSDSVPAHIQQLRNLVGWLRGEQVPCIGNGRPLRKSLSSSILLQRREAAPQRTARPSSAAPQKNPDGLEDCSVNPCHGGLRSVLKQGMPSTGALLERVALSAGSCFPPKLGRSQTIRDVAEMALSTGRTFLTVAELVDAICTTCHSTPPEAVAVVREAWEAGDLQSYSDMAELLQPTFFSGKHGLEQLTQSVDALQDVHVSAVCTRLTWPLLKAVLGLLQSEQIRSSLNVIVEVCQGAFCLECDLWDILAAAAMAPTGACFIDAAPWPEDNLESMDSETQLLSSIVLALSTTSTVAGTRVFPPYSATLESVVEHEFQSQEGAGCNIELWLQGAHAAASANGLVLTVPMILALLSSQQVVPSGCSGGALLWYWEKMCAQSSGRGGGVEPMSAGTTCQADTSNDSASGDSEDDGSMASRDGAEATEPAEDTLTPLEAFISCFYEDLRNDVSLLLSQLNNLYRMRSGSHDIAYRSYGYRRMGEFLAEVPGVEIVGSGNYMAAQASDHAKLAEVEQRVMKGLRQRIEERRWNGQDVSALAITFRRPQAVPKKILARIWDIFQDAEHNEIPVSLFVTTYKERFPHDRLRLKSLGHPDVRSLMAHLPFVEKVGGRRHAKYKLKEDAVPPDGVSMGPSAMASSSSNSAYRFHSSWLSPPISMHPAAIRRQSHAMGGCMAGVRNSSGPASAGASAAAASAGQWTRSEAWQSGLRPGP